MIDKKELRRRNILLYIPNGKYISVESIGEYWINAAGGNEGDAYDKLAGIPLTEEILLKCPGVKLLKLNGILYFEINVYLCIIKTGDLWAVSTLKRDGVFVDLGVRFKFLHELQNIYYWLSGKKELEVKL